MAETLVVKDVPAEKVDKLVQQHKEMGAKKIEQTKQDNGLYSVKLTYENDAA
jgi:predicted lactoylglutathione lyase